MAASDRVGLRQPPVRSCHVRRRSPRCADHRPAPRCHRRVRRSACGASCVDGPARLFRLIADESPSRRPTPPAKSRRCRARGRPGKTRRGPRWTTTAGRGAARLAWASLGMRLASSASRLEVVGPLRKPVGQVLRDLGGLGSPASRPVPTSGGQVGAVRDQRLPHHMPGRDRAEGACIVVEARRVVEAAGPGHRLPEPADALEGLSKNHQGGAETK